jgi:hypothetical protein
MGTAGAFITTQLACDSESRTLAPLTRAPLIVRSEWELSAAGTLGSRAKR